MVGVDVMPAAANWSLRYQMPRTPPNHGTPYTLPFWVSLASMPETRSGLVDQADRSVEMLARAPSEASVGVSVLPSSVMSGAFLPLASALVQSVVRLAQGTQTTLTLVFLYCG